MLGHITQDTFQQCARLQRDNPTPAQREAIESILSRSTNNTPVRLVPVNIADAFNQLTPNTGALMCSSRPTGIGHSMVIARNERGENVLIDPSIGREFVGDDIQRYLQSENLTSHSVPIVPPGPITMTPFGGGGKCIMVNIPKSQDMYAMLGMVADKTFSRLVNKSSVPLTLVSIDLENMLHKMTSNKATLIYGEKTKGHTMILLKKSRLELLDPVTNVKYVGYSEIMKYLSTFTRIMTLYNTNTRSKSRTFKSKSRKSRTFKSQRFKRNWKIFPDNNGI